jgi:hypothetical protein
MTAVEPEQLWARIDKALLAIKPDLDEVGLRACRRRIDPDGHYYAADIDAQAQQSKDELARLNKALVALRPALDEFRAALDSLCQPTTLLLRQAAHQHRVRFPPELPGLEETVSATVAANETIAKSGVLRRRKLATKVARSVADAVAGVYFDLTGRTPTTSHPDQRTTPEPYHDLMEAVFDGRWVIAGLPEPVKLKNWKELATKAAEHLRRHLRGNFPPGRAKKSP